MQQVRLEAPHDAAFIYAPPFNDDNYIGKLPSQKPMHKAKKIENEIVD
jgi:hypothetical protein